MTILWKKKVKWQVKKWEREEEWERWKDKRRNKFWYAKNVVETLVKIISNFEVLYEYNDKSYFII